MIFESKRSEADIINKILIETKDGIKKTHLMYKANMSNTQLDRYLKKLIDQQFIVERVNENDGTKFYLTEKGEQLDTAFQQVFNILNQSIKKEY